MHRDAGAIARTEDGWIVDECNQLICDVLREWVSPPDGFEVGRYTVRYECHCFVDSDDFEVVSDTEADSEPLRPE